MSYCVNCGVELSGHAKKCPLCGTPVINPNVTAEPEGKPFFPTRPPEIQPVSRREAALLLTVMLGGAGVACGLANLVFSPRMGWSLYIIAAVITLWIWFVLPLLLRNMPMFFRLTVDVGAIAIYTYLVSVDLDGAVWFYGLAFPILLWAAFVLFLLSFLLRGHRISMLSSIAMSIGAIGIFCFGLEFCIDRYFSHAWAPGWSLIVVIICTAFVVPLRVIRRVPSLREEARRRFHL